MHSLSPCISPQLHKLTVVEKYANFGSTMYAPVLREGKFPDNKPLGKKIETEGYQPATIKVSAS